MIILVKNQRKNKNLFYMNALKEVAVDGPIKSKVKAFYFQKVKFAFREFKLI